MTAFEQEMRLTVGLLTKYNFVNNCREMGSKKDAHRRQFKALIILLRFKAVADRRQWPSAASKPLRKMRVRLDLLRN